jgi:hypothetical protein
MQADSIARAAQDSINRTLPGYVVDSILPIQEELRRFRLAAGGEAVAELRGGSRSRVSLIRRFVKAVAARDTADLKAMNIDAREFADLIYPESPYTRSPYRQSPTLVWDQIQNPNRAGLNRLVRRMGGRPLGYAGYSCEERPERQGRNVVWTGCLVQLADSSGEIVRRRLFGSIIERDSQFKIVSYTNEF